MTRVFILFYKQILAVSLLAVGVLSNACSATDFTGSSAKKNEKKSNSDLNVDDRDDGDWQIKVGEEGIPPGFEKVKITDCRIEDKSIASVDPENGCIVTGESVGQTILTVIDDKGKETTIVVDVTDDSSGNPTIGSEDVVSNGGDLEIDSDELTKKADVVRKLTATLKYDGVGRFCVDFKKGEVGIEAMSGRIEGFAEVAFTVQMNKDTKTHKWSTNNPGQNIKMPGDWKFVKDATLQLKNPVRCTDDRAEKGPTNSVSKNGSKICVNFDDQHRKQSGDMCYNMDFNIVTAAKE